MVHLKDKESQQMDKLVSISSFGRRFTKHSMRSIAHLVHHSIVYSCSWALRFFCFTVDGDSIKQSVTTTKRNKKNKRNKNKIRTWCKRNACAFYQTGFFIENKLQHQFKSFLIFKDSKTQAERSQYTDVRWILLKCWFIARSKQS